MFKIQHTVTTDIITGRRNKGRQRWKILDSFTKWRGRSLNIELINITWTYGNEGDVLLT
jgi:hypothetical protein